MEGLTKAKYFADLLDEETVTTSVKEAGSGGDDNTSISGSERPLDEDNMSAHGGDGSDDDDDVDMGENDLPYPHDATSLPALLSLRQELHTPLIHLPKSLASSNSTTQESLMPVDTNETELLKELQEEQELDNVDGILAKEFEADLWKRSGKV